MAAASVGLEAAAQGEPKKARSLFSSLEEEFGEVSHYGSTWATLCCAWLTG